MCDGERSQELYADAAFVGRAIAFKRGPGVRGGPPRVRSITFAVERALKGRLGPTVEVAHGFRLPFRPAHARRWVDGRARVGLFLYRVRGRWDASACGLLSPAEMLLRFAPRRAPAGSGPAAVVVAGRFYGARLASFDAKGRVLAYAEGEAPAVALSACPDGRFVVELLTEPSRIAVRELPSLRLVRETALAILPRFGHYDDLACRDEAAASVAVASEVEGNLALSDVNEGALIDVYSAPGRLVAFATRSTFVATSCAMEKAPDSTPTCAHRHAGELSLPAGQLGALFDVEPIPDYMFWRRHVWSASPGSPSLLANLADDRLNLIDPSVQPARVRSVDVQARANAYELLPSVSWLDERRLGVFVPSRLSSITIYDTDLRELARLSGWEAWSPVASGDQVYGLTDVGRDSLGRTPRAALRMVSARLPTGPIRTLPPFRVQEVSAMVAIPSLTP